jgi:hypothetical protein
VVAVGTTVVRALESAAHPDGGVRSGAGVASGRIGAQASLRTVDALLTGVHQPGESHFELLRAFAGDALLARISAAFAAGDYLAHEFGDSMLLERQPRGEERASKLSFAVTPDHLPQLAGRNTKYGIAKVSARRLTLAAK